MSSDTQAEPSGSRGAAGGRFSVTNPATGEVLRDVAEMGSPEVAGLVAAARSAQAGWDAIGFKARGRAMRAWRRWVVDHRDEIVAAVVEESGKTPEDAMLEILYIADSFGFWGKRARRYLGRDRVHSHSPMLLGRGLSVTHAPLGVIGVIAAWNFPLILGIGDSIPALMAGNAVVLKPSEITPISAQVLARGAHEAGIPEDAFAVATGAGETGEALVDEVDMIQFTGSTETGRRVAQRCAERLIPCGLELGGKDAMVVLGDANVDRAVNVAVEWGMRNSGQICASVERVYVEAPVYDEFVTKVVDRIEALRQGPPAELGSVDIGALTAPGQIDIVESHVEDAVGKGAVIRTGGKRGPGPGTFYEPTVLTEVDHTMRCMTEETFGPTLPIMKVKDAEEALRLANDTTYGLAGSVFSKNSRKARELAARLDAGNVWINDAMTSYFAQEAPFGGHRQSGLGVRHSPQGIRKYCSVKTVMQLRVGLTKDPTMFPNSPRVFGFLDRVLGFRWGSRGAR